VGRITSRHEPSQVSEVRGYVRVGVSVSDMTIFSSEVCIEKKSGKVA
jgi:hypothetical protein